MHLLDVFRLHIQYLFVYLFKLMSTEAGASVHLYLFTYANDLLKCAFDLNIQYLFVYLLQSMSTDPCESDHLYLFIYAKLSVGMCFRFEYSVSVCLFITIDVNRSRCKCPPVLVYLCKSLCWHVLSL